MLWNKRIITLLVLIFLFSTFVAVPHFHEDMQDHDDCPICVASNHQTATGSLVTTFDGIPYYSETTVVLPTLVSTYNCFSQSLNSRGPPA